MRSTHLILVACILALTFSPRLSAASTASRPAPRYANPVAGAKPLVLRFFVLLERKNRAGLERFLSHAFQVQRADGSASGKAAYLANLPSVIKFYISDLVATQAGSTLVARYLARVEGRVNGKAYTPGPAPRLSVFAWNGKRWQLAAHANFNPLKG
ncbi:MAG: hypothetical protein C5B48_06740 [Candidatus Rokuibacteriota bacterium]|nr:MAG: hypothetical protein C5B48_06740 [Candidatus Rokubacteria bacterium]